MFKLEDEKDVVPDQQRRRKLSVRAYNAEHMMINNGVVDGVDLEAKAGEMFADLDVKYIHVHYAGAGGFAVKIERNGIERPRRGSWDAQSPETFADMHRMLFKR
uniref:Uncharacterized protein n=1 Tax=Coccidioides posadasii RMSCC 3488 TaxID=454284 RepID=A0A0J6F9X1_COCPO|nr:hypothetical protein CPAG_02400 [Coccidioides posadasii RMSCC 3488]